MFIRFLFLHPTLLLTSPRHWCSLSIIALFCFTSQGSGRRDGDGVGRTVQSSLGRCQLQKAPRPCRRRAAGVSSQHGFAATALSDHQGAPPGSRLVTAAASSSSHPSSLRVLSSFFFPRSYLAFCFLFKTLDSEPCVSRSLHGEGCV